MANEDAYKETKEYTCVCCGKKVILTKFASAKTAKCPECKSSGAPVDQSILEQVIGEVKAHKQEIRPTIQGNQKPSKCTVCGKEVMIGKFSSHANTLCDEHKGNSPSHNTYDDDGPRITINTNKIGKNDLISLDEIYNMSAVIPNKKLREVTCPKCGGKTTVIKILDGSPFGLIIDYQCNDCYLQIGISEQCKYKMRPSSQATIFNYRGEQIVNMLTPLTDTRIRNAFDYLMKLLTDNNIPVDGLDISDWKIDKSDTKPSLDNNDDKIKDDDI